MMKTLYIIGNGFDLAHGLPSSYGNFETYCAEHSSKLYAQITSCLSNLDETWSNFENALGRQEISVLKQYMVRNNILDRDYPVGIDYSELIFVFRHWVVKLNEVLKNKITRDEIQAFVHLSKNDFYLNFNYTPTLEKLYHIPYAHVNHIHGREDVDDYALKDDQPFCSLIYGHSLTKEDIIAQIEDHDEDEFHKQDYVDTVIGFAKNFQVEALTQWIEQLHDITQIIVLGHSMDEVDEKYYKILLSYFPDVEWKIGYYEKDADNSDFLKKKRRCCDLNIHKFSLFKF